MHMREGEARTMWGMILIAIQVQQGGNFHVDVPFASALIQWTIRCYRCVLWLRGDEFRSFGSSKCCGSDEKYINGTCNVFFQRAWRSIFKGSIQSLWTPGSPAASSDQRPTSTWESSCRSVTTIYNNNALWRHFWWVLWWASEKIGECSRFWEGQTLEMFIINHWTVSHFGVNFLHPQIIVTCGSIFSCILTCLVNLYWYTLTKFKMIWILKLYSEKSALLYFFQSACRVKSKEDTALAANVASYLVVSLREYYKKIGPPTIVHVSKTISF